MNFKFTTAGESHGPALVTIIEGVPAGLPIDKAAIDHELWRRQQGYGRGGRMKIETDTVTILSGVRHGKALGSPIGLMIENRDFVHWTEIMSAEAIETQPKNPRIVKRPRPGHADLAGGQKDQTRDLRDILERASARETAARVAAGAVARQLLALFGVDIKSHVAKLGAVPETPIEAEWEAISAIPKDAALMCADKEVEAAMMAHIDDAKEKGDTLGGIFEVVAKNLPVGLGSHTSWEDKLDGRIARAIMSIHAVKAVEIGEGVANAGRPGSQVHDEIFWSEPPASAGGQSDASSNWPAANAAGSDKGFYRKTNRAGGLEGGITNGEELRVRGYLKPISTLKKPLHSVDIDTKEDSPAAFERSDVTAVPAAGVIGEAMLAIVLANSFREKFGGDSIDEMRRNFENYQTLLLRY
ncbi:MAG: chorismate synthase [Acidobacteria bacterium]|nr:chorismate synthase [Acidobacteriota bacterium]